MKYQPPFVPGATPGAPGIYNANPDASYVNGNPATGQEGSYFPGEALEHAMRELVKIITSANLTPLHTDLEQVAEGVARYGSVALFGTDTSATANTVTVVKSGNTVVPKALFHAMRLHFSPAVSNTGAVTATVFGLTAKPIRTFLDTALSAGDLLSGRPVMLEYNAFFNSGSGAWVLLPWSRDNAFNIQSQGYVSAGTSTFTVPAGVTRLRVRCWGAGGGGGGAAANGYGASGGNGGGYAEGYVPVAPGQNITVTVGAGGAGGTDGSTNGSNGGNTSFGSFVTASGGQGGLFGNTSAPGLTPTSVGVGAGSNATVTMFGSRGAQGGGPANGYGALGGFGGSSPMGGGNAPGTTAGGNVGQTPGGGGAGGGGFTGSAVVGGVGAPGTVIVEWINNS